jgi:FHA domain
MSFRLFIYYCAVCGGCAAFIGWVLGRMAPVEHHVLGEAVKGMFLGMVVALALGLIDALWIGHARAGRMIRHVGAAVGIGSVGGFVGGFFGQALYIATGLGFFVILGWIITGFLIGAAPGGFDYIRSTLANADARGPMRKVLRGVIGGAVGGFLGSTFYLLLEAVWKSILRDKEGTFWSPSATGFVILGLCIGLLIGLAQVILKEAWLKVESGFRPGRELILGKAETVIGRAEGCDLGLFGDQGVEKTHARIIRKGDRWLLVDDSSSGSTLLNGRRINGPTPLEAGDEIRLGRNVIRFEERRKKVAS